VSALLFAIHPLRVESVAWATERRDVLSGFFFLATVYCYLSAVSLRGQSARMRWLGLALAGYALSLLSKAIGITLPVVLLLLDVYPLKRLRGKPSDWLKPEFRAVLMEKIPFVVFAAGFAIAALFAQHTTGALKPLDQFDLFSRLLQASFGYFFYLWKTILPIGLSPIYELPIDVGNWLWLFVLAALVTISLTVALICRRHRWPAALACWIYYLIVLAPVTGVAQSGPQLVADRYSYLACLGWPLLIGGGLLRIWQRGNANQNNSRVFFATGTVVVTLFLFAVLTWNQTEVWRTAQSLWQHAIAVGPTSSIAHYNLGRTFEREENSGQAIEHYRQAITINPTYSKAHFNLARLLALKGFESEAMQHYRRVLEIRPDHADAHNDLGLLFEMKNDVAAAMSEFKKAIELDTGHYKAFFNLAELLARENDLAGAINNYQHAARINPNEAAIHIRLALALARQGELQSATSHFQRAVVLQPDAADTHVLLARSLAAQGKTAEAAGAYREAMRLIKATGKSPASELRDTK
jgi:tetratricopeptide (TPR) repeat protein